MHSNSVFRAAGIAGLMLAAFCGLSTATVTDHSLSFDGVAQYATVNDPVQITDGPFSLEMWIWVSSLTEFNMILSNRDGSNGYGLYVYPGIASALSMGLVLNGALVAFDEVGANTQEWVHLAVTWGGVASGEIKLYGNGQLLHTYTNFTTPIVESPGKLRIGMWLGMFYFTGLIDDVRIWSVALDQQTIETWRWQPVDASHPNWADLKAYWKFDEGSGQTARSEVNSTAYDATLGETGAEEPSDPIWSDVVSPVPIEETTLGRLRWKWYSSER